jgi:biopolymer transport protein TolQ
LLRLLWQAGPAAKIILLLLAGFSVLSWAVMWDRWKTFRAAESETDRFGELFRSTANLAQFRDQQGEFGATPLRALFRAGFQELSQSVPRKGETATPPQREVGMRNLDRALGRAQREENGRLERGLGFLATTASATPFIGLLGTVWGIMNAFQGIGLTGTANLAVVAPGIAEALFATALGLVAAIPATIFYNKFAAEVNKQAQRLEGFADEFSAILSRQIDERG